MLQVDFTYLENNLFWKTRAETKHYIEELVKEHNRLEKEIIPQRPGTFLYAITHQNMSEEFRHVNCRKAHPFIILVRNGEYIINVHSMHLALGDMRFANRCGYYNDRVHDGTHSWEEVVDSYTGDLDDWMMVDKEFNYHVGFLEGFLLGRIKNLKALREYSPVVIELRHNEILFPKGFKNIVLGLEKNSHYSRPHDTYVNYSFALTKPKKVNILAPVGTRVGTCKFYYKPIKVRTYETCRKN